jgi:hypothetical protein
LNLAADIQHKGCEHHRGQCRLRRCGNPITCVTFYNTQRQQVNWANEAGYEEKGCSQLLPSDVRRLRNYFIAMNTLVGLQHWCVTIIFILLALRHDEFHSISDTSFVQALFEITDERVDCLVLPARTHWAAGPPSAGRSFIGRDRSSDEIINRQPAQPITIAPC